jgi:short subunit dehydrogenase-like uncharacterized protein
MAARIVIFGATGYTGRLTAERLAAAGTGASLVLAGRNDEKLAELASRLGGVEWVRADALRANSVFSAVGEGDVVVSTVGPFAKYGDAAVRAAIAAGATYLDSTGEPAFIRRVFDEFAAPAQRAGATLLPAMGYDYVPGQLAAALALEEAGGDAVRVDVGYYALGADPKAALSAGTKESAVGIALGEGFAYRGGRIVASRLAERVRTFDVRGRERSAVSIPGSEHYALPPVYPQLQEVNVYLGWFGPLARGLQAGTLAGSIAVRVPGVRGALQAVGERLASLTGAPEAGTTPGGQSWIAATAYDVAGEPLADVRLTGVDPYDFTANFLSWAARRLASHPVERSGALGALEAFGLETLEAGCAEAGLERVREPAAA